MLKAGDKLWNGTTATEQLANAYNRIDARIKQYESRGLQPPEHLLNGRFNLLNFKPI